MCRYRALCEFAGCLVPIVLETFFGVLGDMRVAIALYLRDDPWVQSERLLIYLSPCSFILPVVCETCARSSCLVFF
jgi:hypothetical protein